MTIKQRKTIRQIFMTILLMAGGIGMIFPFLYMLSTAFKGAVFVFEIPPRLIPAEPTIKNFIDAWTSNQFGRYFLNSILVSGITIPNILILGSMMAYAFSRFNFLGKKFFYGLVVFFMTMPAMSLIVPQFVLARNLHLTDKLAGLVLMYIAQNLPFAVFLLRGFLEEIPKDIEDAARIDGASSWAIYWQVILPLCKPALATSAIISFLGAWDEFVWANTLINSPEKRTLPVAIANFQGVHTTNWGLVFAASIIAVIPVIILFVTLQKYFIKGMVAGAIKG